MNHFCSSFPMPPVLFQHSTGIHQHPPRQTKAGSPSAGRGAKAETPRTLTGTPSQHIHPASTNFQSHQSGGQGRDAQKAPNPAQLQWQQCPSLPREPQLHVLPVTRGPAPATTALVLNSQQLPSRAARQTHWRSPQLNVDNYGCLHQGTALPRLRRKKHILIPLRL